MLVLYLGAPSSCRVLLITSHHKLLYFFIFFFKFFSHCYLLYFRASSLRERGLVQIDRSSLYWNGKSFFIGIAIDFLIRQLVI